MIKRILTFVLIITILLMHTVAFAESKENTEKRQSLLEQIEEFDRQYQLHRGDAIKAVDAMLASDSSLKRVGECITSSYRIVNGELISVVDRSSPSNISFTDQIVYDSDWGTYVYHGTWRWKTSPNESNLDPNDVIGVYSTKPNEVSPLDYFINCYNSNNTKVGYYNSNSGITDGSIAKGIETADGAGFWIPEASVVRGNMSVPLTYVSGAPSNSTAKIMQYYSHSWTSSNLTGLGGSISIDGGGIDVSWSTGVNSWEVTSAGKRLSQAQ